MKQNINLKSYIFAAALSLGVGSIASAQQTATAASAATTTDSTASGGLLGARYFGAGYDYIAINNSTSNVNHAQGFELAYNQPVTANLDLGADYNWARARYAGTRLTQETADLNAAAYTKLDWGKPFAAASVGWAWTRASGVHDDSFLYKLGVGVEFPVAQAFAVSPYVNFARATGFNTSEVEFGVKAEYKVTKEIGVFGRVQYDAVRHDDNQTEFAAGLNYHF